MRSIGQKCGARSDGRQNEPGRRIFEWSVHTHPDFIGREREETR